MSRSHFFSCILILYSQLCLGLKDVLFTSGFPLKSCLHLSSFRQISPLKICLHLSSFRQIFPLKSCLHLSSFRQISPLKSCLHLSCFRQVSPLESRWHFSSPRVCATCPTHFILLERWIRNNKFVRYVKKAVMANLRNYPATILEELRKTTYLRTGDVLTEIKTGNSPNTSYKLYCLGRRWVIPKVGCM